MRRILCAAMGMFVLAACAEDKPKSKAKIEHLDPTNGAPSLASASLGEGPFTVDSTIKVTLGKAADADGDEVTFKYQWYVNGSAEPGAVGDSLAGAFAKGDEVYVEVTPTDGTNEGKTVASEAVMIRNTPPVATSASLGAGPYRKADTITAFATGTDADGDAVGFTFRWYVNGTYVSTGSSLAGAFAKGDVVTSEATPYDGIEGGTSVLSSPTTVVNTAPTMLSVNLGAGPFHSNDSLTASPAASDADGDTVTFTYRWFVNGTETVGATSASLAGLFTVDDSVVVEATPSDGAETGAAVLSSAALIVNSPPSTPGVAIFPGVVTAGALNLWAEVVTPSTDPDGDIVGYTYNWYRNGSLQGYAASQTLVSAANIVAGDTWRVEVVAADTVTNSSASVAEAVVYLAAKQVGAGTDFTCAITHSGGLKCWGLGDQGQLGTGDTADRSRPADVAGLTTGIQAISAGNGFACALTAGGGVKCWGRNDLGQLGIGNTTPQNTPVDVSGLTSGVTKISTRFDHTCALTTGGGVKCWGSNAQGQLGTGDTTDRPFPITASNLTSGITAIATGLTNTCAVTTGGGVKCWGDGLSITDVSGLTSGVQAIAAANRTSCALTTGGGVKCWGQNYSGSVGNGSWAAQSTPVQVTGLSSGVQAISAGARFICALMIDGAAKCWGNNESSQLGNVYYLTTRNSPIDVTGLTGAAQIAAGNRHTCAVTIGGGIKCWGFSGFGALGNKETENQPFPVDVTGLAAGVQALTAGDQHNCVVTGTGAVSCWGDNSEGQLGVGDLISRLAPAEVSNVTSGIQALAAGFFHTCSLSTGGGVKCWGANSLGQLGIGFNSTRVPTATDVSGLSSNILRIVVGAYHTCAMTSGGGVKCWGKNQEGQLGKGDTLSSPMPKDVTGMTSGVESIAAGGHHTCVLVNGGVKCWGYNYFGQIGNNNTVNQLTAVDVSGLGSGVQSIALGYAHSCALTDNGGVMCWGYNGGGQLGNGNKVDQWTPTNVAGLSSGVQAITAGAYHTCALLTGDVVKCWGYNAYGQLGDGYATDQTMPVTVVSLRGVPTKLMAGGMHTCALNEVGGASCWGYNARGQVGNPGATGLIPSLPVIGFVP